ncbi:MFS transporter [Peribacillus simplex]|uniref:MFS transporter n=2 Tax=Peribacillus simplex TaxID=1478 RepID=A0A223EFN6_9BACI|nr:MFS transporter [Peribacillus simplex]ASS94040.1 MFS transporter [Peribacillus simplex NBRC 15720 = DSM 1321]MEC1400386.1 MFS transporter [Peribacillus simplex]MED3908670.1 MFS transporter [Peribacillus simplex]TVX80182.1 MFS transporter [Peribacillus simplex]CAH0304918.1 Multidrug resistance protein 3 [Peribacillus simplex]
MRETLVDDRVRGTDKIWTRDFIMICLANMCIFMGFQMTMPTLPLFVEQLGGDDRLVGAVLGIFTFSALLVRPIAGRLLETKGRRIVFLAGLAIFALSVGSFGFMGSIGLLFMMRIVQGVGWGFSSTASGTIASDIIPAKRRGEGMGYYGLSGNLALAFGPSLGLFLVTVLPFQELFLICSLLGLFAIIAASLIRYQKAESDPSAAVRAKRFDIYEKSALQPSLLIFFISVTFGGIATFLPLYTAEKGVDGIQWYFLVYAMALMVTRLFAGRLYDRRGHRAIFVPSTVLIMAGMLLLAWMPSETVLYIAAVLYGFGFGSVQPTLQAWSIEKTAPNRKAMANATYFSFFDLGVGIGAIVFGQIGFLFGYRSIYITAAASIFISMIVYLCIIRSEDKVKLMERR